MVLVVLPIFAYFLAMGAGAMKARIADLTHNLKTIAAYQTQPPIEAQVSAVYSRESSQCKATHLVSQLKEGFGTAMNYWFFALMFWYANYLQEYRDVDVKDLTKALFACSVTVHGVSVMLLFAPNFLEGLKAAGGFTK